MVRTVRALFVQAEHKHEKLHGVYAFYNYDGEPIYVGQTVEKLRVRIRRHLTNQRTDAVAMKVLDPFEVAEIEMWPFFDLASDDVRETLDAAEFTVYEKVLSESSFRAVLNEKGIPKTRKLKLPPSVRGGIIPKGIYAARKHADVRIARRASTITEQRYRFCKEEQEKRIVEMEEQLETERMRVVACGVAAGCNTEESIARHGIKQGNPYWTPAYGDVCGAVKREMEYREKNKALEDQVGALINRLNMCETIAKCGPDFVFPKEGDHSYSDAARAVLDLRREWNTLREREKAYADRLAVFITWLCSIAPGSPMRSDKHQAAATKGRTDRQLHAALTGKGKSRKPVSKKHRGARR